MRSLEEDATKPPNQRRSSSDDPRCRSGVRLIRARKIVGGRRVSSSRIDQGGATVVHASGRRWHSRIPRSPPSLPPKRAPQPRTSLGITATACLGNFYSHCRTHLGEHMLPPRFGNRRPTRASGSSHCRTHASGTASARESG
jgi:hypothetical protein